MKSWGQADTSYLSQNPAPTPKIDDPLATLREDLRAAEGRTTAGGDDREGLG